MSVYRLDFALNDYAGLLTVDENDLDRLGPFDGTPQAETWEHVALRWEPNDSRPVPDATEVAGAPVLGPRAREALGDLLDGRGEWLPVEVGGSEGWHLFNVTRLSDGLDEERSELSRFGDGRLRRVEVFEFDPAVLSDETVFKLAQKPRWYEFATDTLRDRVGEAELTGFKLEDPVWSAPPINR